MSDLVSVVIPTYNRVHCLAAAIDSALAQTHPAIEVVVIDDGSSDGTEALVAGRYRRDVRVRYAWQANAGVVAARNRGLAMVQGDYVAFLDSDDWWQPWKIAVQLAALAQFPAAGMVWSDMQAIDADGAVIGERYLRTMYGAYGWYPRVADLFPDSRTVATPVGPAPAHCGEIYSQMLMGPLVHTSTMMLTRPCLDRVGGFDPAMAPSGEDFDFHLRTAREGPVVLVDIPTIRYQRGMPDQLTRLNRRIAISHLKTITKAMDTSRDRIVLPQWMINRAFAQAHRWLAEESIAERDYAAGRRHCLKSLTYRPRQLRPLVQAILCTLPPTAGEGMRALYRLLKPAR